MNINNDTIPQVLEQAEAFIESGYISKVKALELARECKLVIENEPSTNTEHLRTLLKSFLYELISSNSAATETGESEFIDVLVVEHETIESLANNFNTTVDVIKKVNPGFKPNEALRTGSILKVPRID